MALVRISLFRPKKGSEERVQQLLFDLDRFHRTLPGYQGGYTLRNRDGAGELGRVSIWADETSDDHAAIADRDLALRAELTRLVERESHRESQYDSLAAP